jgi:hypothetical protein
MADPKWVEGEELFAPKHSWVEGHELEAGPPAPPPTPTVGQAILRGGAQGATMGFADESAGAGGLLGSLYGKYAPEFAGGAPSAYAKEIHPLESYKEARDAYREKDAATKSAHGGYFTAAELAGSIPTAFLPGLNVAKGASLGTTALRTGAAGALAGLGSSEGKTKLDDALAALAGAGIGAGLGAVGYRLGRFGQKAGEEVRLANADAAMAAEQKAGKLAREARGAYGGEVASVLDVAKSAADTLADPLATTEEKALAQARLADPAFRELVKNARLNKFALSTERQVGSMLNAKAAHEAAQAAKAPEAVEKAAEESMAQPFRRQVLPRLMLYGERLVPPLLGWQHGGLAGAAMGTGVGLLMGKPGTSLANMVKNPGVRRAMWSGLEKTSAVPSAAGWVGTHAGPETASLELSPQIQAMLMALKGGAEPEPQWEP